MKFVILVLFCFCRLSVEYNLNQRTCPSGHVQCEDGFNWDKDADQQCVKTELRCDGKFDCSDGSDEKYCDGNFNFGYRGFIYLLIQGACRDAGRVMCRSAEYNVLGHFVYNCISKKQVCNNKIDCKDGSDEKHCPYVLDKGFHFEFSQEECPTDSYKCKNGSSCIKKSSICNGQTDCDDESDEAFCPYFFTAHPSAHDSTLEQITSQLELKDYLQELKNVTEDLKYIAQVLKKGT